VGRAAAALAQGSDWESALEAVLRSARGVVDEPGGVDLALLFASAAYQDRLPDIVRRARSETGASVLAGCSGVGIIGQGREIEQDPAISLLSLSLPGAALRPVRVTQDLLKQSSAPADWHALAGVGPEAVNAWLLFCDPFQIDAEALVDSLSAAYPGKPLIGGLASGDPQARETFVFQDDQVFADGAVAVAVGGAYTVKTVVSQGAEPLGESWTITSARGNVIETIGQRPAFDVLVETMRALPADAQRRVQRNLLVGLAMDEYRDAFGRGDFLIRNLFGADPTSGGVAVGAEPKVGQTLQFQLRDARAADEELRDLLGQAKKALDGREPVAAVLCSCTGRGEGLFGEPDHDARALAELLDLTNVAGFFCNGEIGPVGSRNFLHGYTASIALFVPTD